MKTISGPKEGLPLVSGQFIFGEVLQVFEEGCNPSLMFRSFHKFSVGFKSGLQAKTVTAYY